MKLTDNSINTHFRYTILNNFVFIIYVPSLITMIRNRDMDKHLLVTPQPEKNNKVCDSTTGIADKSLPSNHLGWMDFITRKTPAKSCHVR